MKAALTRLGQFLGWIPRAEATTTTETPVGEGLPIAEISSVEPCTPQALTFEEMKKLCTKGAVEGAFVIEVLGVSKRMRNTPLCEGCSKIFLNAFSVLCAQCKTPIFPGEPVGQSWVGAETPVTHMYWDCTATGALYCGKWGEGRLITLGELNPFQFGKGAPSIAAHVLKTGRSFSGKIK